MGFVTKDVFWIEGDNSYEFIVQDSFYVSPIAEEFLKELEVKLSKDSLPIKVYLSTTNPNNHWLYDLYNKKEEWNEQLYL